MNTAELRALQTLILATPACAPYVHTNEMDPITGAEVVVKDRAIAGILSVNRTRPQTHLITERGVRESLPIVSGATFLKVLRELSESETAPAWLPTVLTGIGVPTEDQWAYHDALRCGWTWLRADGLDLSAVKVRQLLDLIVAGHNELASAATALKALGQVPDPVSPDNVSLALRGPWGDE